MRHFITLPLLVAEPNSQSWTDRTTRYHIQEWDVDPSTIHGFHAEWKGRFMEVYTADGRFKVEMTRAELLEALGVLYAPEQK